VPVLAFAVMAVARWGASFSPPLNKVGGRQEGVGSITTRVILIKNYIIGILTASAINWYIYE
jgi:hypothetical protein